MSSFNIDIDSDEFLSGCTRFERMEIYDQLHEEFGDSAGPFTGAATPTETDLLSSLLEIWNRRSLLTNEQRELIASLTTASTLQG